MERCVKDLLESTHFCYVYRVAQNILYRYFQNESIFLLSRRQERNGREKNHLRTDENAIE